jgi:putative ABC transport system substrate-binding protein
VARIGLLGPGSAEESPFFGAFRQGLRDQGWIEGQTVAFEDRSKVAYSRLPNVAAELVRLKVDVIVAAGTTAALAAKKATGTIPIVTAVGSDPVQSGLVAGLARPGGNVTGMTNLSRDLTGKRLELLKDTVPAATRIAWLWTSENRTGALSLRDAEAAGRALGFRIQPVDLRRPEDLDQAFASMVRERAEALVPASSNMIRAHRVRVVELAARHRLPGVFDARVYVEAGGLMSYAPDIKDTYRRLATYVDRILKGTRPGDLPIEQPSKLELVINLQAAKALGLTIPPAVLARADEVVR